MMVLVFGFFLFIIVKVACTDVAFTLYYQGYVSPLQTLETEGKMSKIYLLKG